MKKWESGIFRWEEKGYEFGEARDLPGEKVRADLCSLIVNKGKPQEK